MSDQQPTRYGYITEEGIAKFKSHMFKPEPIREPFVRYVNGDSITHSARAIGDANPLWIDEEYGKKTRYGKNIAPPALYYAVTWGSWDMRRGEGLPGVHGLHAYDDWTYYRPLYDGDKVNAIKQWTGLDERTGAYAGRSLMQRREFQYFNQHGQLVAKCEMASVRAERHKGKETGKYAKIERAKYTPEDIRKIDDEIRAEVVRGVTPRYWEDTQVGEPVAPIVRGPLQVADMIAWMMGTGSPHVRSGQYWLAYRERHPKIAIPDPHTGVPQAIERVHWDEFMASEIGMPGPYDYGSQRGAWATHLITNWAGDDSWVARVYARFRGMNFIGDTLWISGAVTKKWRGSKTGIGYVELSIQGVNQRGDNIMPGSAIVALPSRGQPLPDFPIDHEADMPNE